MLPAHCRATIAGYNYDTDHARLVAGDDYCDIYTPRDSNGRPSGGYERNGTNTFLYEALGGRFFAVKQTARNINRVAGAELQVVSTEQAREMLRDLTRLRMSAEELERLGLREREEAARS